MASLKRIVLPSTQWETPWSVCPAVPSGSNQRAHFVRMTTPEGSDFLSKEGAGSSGFIFNPYFFHPEIFPLGVLSERTRWRWVSDCSEWFVLGPAHGYFSRKTDFFKII